jgi:hypothetical protein
VNDLYYEGKVTAAADLVDQIAERMETIAAKARAIGATVWIATALPNRRDPEALVDALNTRIRARADDYFPVGERFAERDWRHLLADDVHPTEDGSRCSRTSSRRSSYGTARSLRDDRRRPP